LIGFFLLPFTDDNIRQFGAQALSSRNQLVSQPVSAAKFNAAGARPTLVNMSFVLGGVANPVVVSNSLVLDC